MTRSTLPLAALLLLAARHPAAAQGPSPATERCPGESVSAADSAREAVSEAIRATLATAAASAGITEPTGLVVVMMDRDGGRPVFRAHDSNLPDAALSVAAPHVAGLAAAWPGEGRIRLAVRLDPRPLPDCRGGRGRREIDPRFLSAEEGRERMRRIAESSIGQRIGTGHLVLWVALDREGRVAYAEVERGEGDILPEATLGELVRTLRMRPASLDGVARDRLFSTPLQYVVPAEGSGPGRTPGRGW